MDDYITDMLVPQDAALQAALADSAAAGLPPIAVTPNQGKLLELLARIQGARKILELGTLGGYSTIWLARALAPGGRLISLEAEPRYAAVAEANIARAGFDEVVELRVGPGLQTLPELIAEGAGPFDLIFIDADKNNYPGYLELSLRLSRPGTVIVGDNVVRDGRILDPNAYDPAHGDEVIKGVRRFYELLADGESSGLLRHRDPDGRRQGSRRVRTAAGRGYRAATGYSASSTAHNNTAQRRNGLASPGKTLRSLLLPFLRLLDRPIRLACGLFALLPPRLLAVLATAGLQCLLQLLRPGQGLDLRAACHGNRRGLLQFSPILRDKFRWDLQLARLLTQIPVGRQGAVLSLGKNDFGRREREVRDCLEGRAGDPRFADERRRRRGRS